MSAKGLRARELATTLALPGLLAAFYLPLVAHPAPAGFLADEAVYLLTADWFRGAPGPDPGAVATLVSASQYPPLHPLLLALAGGSADLPACHFMVVGCVVAAAGVLVHWARRTLGSRGAALVAGIAWAAAPLGVFYTLDLFSESPYLLLSLAAVATFCGAGRSLSNARLATGSALTGAAVLTRAAGVALLPALLLWCVRRRGWRALPWTALAVLPGVAWLALRPPGHRNTDYLPWLLHGYAGHAAALLRIPAQNALLVWHGFAAQFDALGLPSAPWLALPVLALALGGMLARLLREEPDAVYAACYLLMVLLWPDAKAQYARFVLPLLPLLLVHAACAMRALMARARMAIGATTTTAVALAPAAILMVPSLLVMGAQLARPLPPNLQGFRASRYWLRNPNPADALADVRLRAAAVRAARALRAHVPPGQCIYSELPEFVMLYARRLSYEPLGRNASEATPSGGNCRFSYAMGTVDNVVPMEFIRPGSRLVWVASMPGDPRHIVGLLFENPPARHGTAKGGAG